MYISYPFSKMWHLIVLVMTSNFPYDVDDSGGRTYRDSPGVTFVCENSQFQCLDSTSPLCVLAMRVRLLMACAKRTG